MIELPQEFSKRMKILLGDEYDSFIHSYDEPISRGLLINTAKISSEKFDEIFPYKTENISYRNNARRLVTDQKVGANPLYVSGLFYMQDTGAMTTAASISNFGEKVLDMCAAPGGKSIASALSNPNTLVVSNEINFARCKLLISNIERLGLKNVAVTSLAPKEFAKRTPEAFDTVIVDAPCSGEGMFRKEPDAIAEWNVGLPKMNAERQKEILSCAVKALKNGGTLIYSTCTYSLEENEEIVAWLISEFGMLPILPREEVIAVTSSGIKGIAPIDEKCMRRFYPHKANGEGQFFAVLKKTGENTFRAVDKIPSKITINELKRIREFTDKYLNCELNNIVSQGGSYFVAPALSRTLNLPYVCEGVRIGDITNNRFNPHHNLFTAFGNNFKNVENLAIDDQRVYDYLHGLEIDAKTADSGWCAVQVMGFTLGGGKCVDGRIKNHFPKGLRIVK